MLRFINKKNDSNIRKFLCYCSHRLKRGFRVPMDFGKVEVLMVFIEVLVLQRQGAHQGRRCSLLHTVSLYYIAIDLFFCVIIEISIWAFSRGNETYCVEEVQINGYR